MAVPLDVRSFLEAQVESHEQLQLLLWLRAHPQRAWGCKEVASALGVPAAVADACLRALRRRNLLADVGSDLYQFAPADTALARAVDRCRRATPRTRSKSCG